MVEPLSGIEQLEPLRLDEHQVIDGVEYQVMAALEFAGDLFQERGRRKVGEVVWGERDVDAVKVADRVCEA